jgi:hypothetical protein
MQAVGAIVTSIFVFGVTVWSLVYVFTNIGTPPVLDAKNHVVQDTFANAKSILLVVLPLATTAVGYWLGNKGTADAKDDAKKAAAKTHAVLAAADPADNLLSRAKALDPAAFE